MTERLFDFDPYTGVKTWFSAEDDGDTWKFRREQDVSPILDYNKEKQADGFDKKADMWHAAKVPTLVMYEWATKHGVEMWNPAHKDGVVRLLNSPDYRYLRVNHFMM